MQFVSGTNPALVGRTAMLAGESSASAGSLYSTQEKKDAVNQAYLELWEQARQRDQEFGSSIARFNTVADTVAVDISSITLDGEITTVAVELNGKNFATDTTATYTYLDPSTLDVAERGYNEGAITATTLFVYRKLDSTQEIHLYAPPSVGGTNSLEVRYQGALTALSGDTDSPIIPAAHQDAICWKAAVELLISRNLPWQDQAVKAIELENRFLAHVARNVADPEGQIVSRGRIQQTWATNAGFYKRP